MQAVGWLHINVMFGRGTVMGWVALDNNTTSDLVESEALNATYSIAALA